MFLDQPMPNGLDLVLYAAQEPQKNNLFHWRIYLYYTESEGGMEYRIDSHIPGSIMGTKTRAILSSCTLVGLFQIAAIQTAFGIESAIHRAISKLEATHELPVEKSMEWVFEKVLPTLQKNKMREGEEEKKEEEKEKEEKDLEQSKAVMCDNLEESRREMLDWGNANASVGYSSGKPRALGVSRVCELYNCGYYRLVIYHWYYC